MNDREAEEIAYGPMVDHEEARALGLTEVWEVADYFAVPEEIRASRG